MSQGSTRSEPAPAEAATEWPASSRNPDDIRFRAFRLRAPASMPRLPTRSASASCAANIRRERSCRTRRNGPQNSMSAARPCARRSRCWWPRTCSLRGRRSAAASSRARSWNLLDRDVLAWYASSPDRLKFLRTVQEFRYIIEPEAAALAAQRRSDGQMTSISRACDDMRAARFVPDRTEADTRFHVAILRASGNELLVPLGVLIEFGSGEPFRLRHERGKRSQICPGTARGHREMRQAAAP